MNTTESDFRPATWFGPIKGWHVGLGFVFFFGIIFAVNGTLIYQAISGFDGLEQEDAYRKGRAYNYVLDEMKAQKALGWTTSIKTTPLASGTTPHATTLAVTFKDASGAPVSNLTVHGTFWRPVMQGSDARLPLKETTPGTYEGAFDLAFGGNWEVRIAATGAADQKYAQSQRVVLP
ncbi:MAG: FixH family protein [Parvibaculum sp.]